MSRKRILIIVWSIFVVWLGIIFFLSSQNGEQTAQTSSVIARKIAEWIYNTPDELQVNMVHMVIRKCAHLVLFFGAGILSCLCVSISLNQKGSKTIWIVVIASAITSLCGFYDEWHKQFIVGRHFDHGETLMNIVSGIIGALVWFLIRRRKSK